MSIACLTSGGVDSSVALALLKEQGLEPIAFYIKVWMEDDSLLGDCPWQEDVDFVRQVADLLGVRMEIVSLQREYWDEIVDYTLREVKAGRTPNPDIMCNKLIKFGAFYRKHGKDFDAVATGHYARLAEDSSGRNHLLLCSDPAKDQTYFLSQMSYSQLSHCLFPLGNLDKKQVRQFARKIKLPNAGRADSQGICFLGKISFRDFLKKHVGEKKGPIVEQSSGKILGQHNGYWFFTIGQRNGLNLGGGPWFVVDKQHEENIVYVAHGYDPEAVYVDQIRLADFNWINELAVPNNKLHHPDSAPLNSRYNGKAKFTNESAVHFKIRHTPLLCDGEITESGDREYLLRPKKKVAGVAKGQFAAIYRDGECLGGGRIV
jgi:tRNA (5-methylaminomethyl-2-thiouridylate)-methyltransferase